MGEGRGWAAGRGLTWLLLKAWAVSLLRPHCEQTKSPADLRQSLPLSATSGRNVASIPARLLRLLLPLLPSVRGRWTPWPSVSPSDPRPQQQGNLGWSRHDPGVARGLRRGNGSGGVEHRPRATAAQVGGPLC